MRLKSSQVLSLGAFTSEPLAFRPLFVFNLGWEGSACAGAPEEEEQHEEEEDDVERE